MGTFHHVAASKQSHMHATSHSKSKAFIRTASEHARRYNRSKSTTKQTSTTQNIFILLLFVIVLKKKKNFFWYFLSFIFCNILISIFTFNFSGQDFLGQVEDALFLGEGPVLTSKLFTRKTYHQLVFCETKRLAV